MLAESRRVGGCRAAHRGVRRDGCHFPQFHWTDIQRRLGAALAFCLMIAASRAGPPAWWDDFPRVVQTRSLSAARAYSANAVIQGAAHDPSWGLWFTFGNDDGLTASNTVARFQSAGIACLSYNEAWGQAANPIVELQWSEEQSRWLPQRHFWNWAEYGGGPIAWAGAWTWFDDLAGGWPAKKSEPGYFARPYTRFHPVYGGEPMVYPDGAIATGFLHGPAAVGDPRSSRVYDAGGSKSIHGSVLGNADYEFIPRGRNDATRPGELWIPEAAASAGEVRLGKDAACPAWTNYAFAETLAAVRLAGLRGSWTDNFSGWDSFMAHGPVASAFGDWSVALFRSYLTNRCTPDQLAAWGVLAPEAPSFSITNFDVRSYLLTVASNQYQLSGTSLTATAWSNPGWLTNPVWSAYKIFRRQNGTAALAGYDQAVHAAAALGGETNFALLANDQLPSNGGWARGTFDLASTELSLGWNVAGGPRGFGLPPYGRLAPVYKAAREQGRSRFVNVWLYNHGHEEVLRHSGPALALFYEMLANHATPFFIDGDPAFCGPPETQKAFLSFVARQAAPAFTGRRPVEEVGLYLSTSTINATMLPGDALNFPRQQHQYAVWGWGTALSELHHQYRIVPEWKLAEPGLLASLRVLILPNASVFEAADVAVLRDWVAGGGYLIVTGDSGALEGENGNFAAAKTPVLASLTGVADYEAPPADHTHFAGAGMVRYLGQNPGWEYYQGTAAERAARLAGLGKIIADAYAFLGVAPVLISDNAPTTVGLTLYQNLSARESFIDVNNCQVNARTPYDTTATPSFTLDLARPAWLRSEADLHATILSPDNPLQLVSLCVVSNRIRAQLPPIRHYASIILRSAKAPPAGAADGSPTRSRP